LLFKGRLRLGIRHEQGRAGITAQAAVDLLTAGPHVQLVHVRKAQDDAVVVVEPARRQHAGHLQPHEPGDRLAVGAGARELERQRLVLQVQAGHAVVAGADTRIGEGLAHLRAYQHLPAAQLGRAAIDVEAKVGRRGRVDALEVRLGHIHSELECRLPLEVAHRR
jgi:hypothetical protein